MPLGPATKAGASAASAARAMGSPAVGVASGSSASSAARCSAARRGSAASARGGVALATAQQRARRGAGPRGACAAAGVRSITAACIFAACCARSRDRSASKWAARRINAKKPRQHAQCCALSSRITMADGSAGGVRSAPGVRLAAAVRGRVEAAQATFRQQAGLPEGAPIAAACTPFRTCCPQDVAMEEPPPPQQPARHAPLALRLFRGRARVPHALSGALVHGLHVFTHAPPRRAWLVLAMRRCAAWRSALA